MVGLSEEHLVTSLRELDPGERALLNLSFRHGLPDEELGGLMRISSPEIASRRRDALEAIAGGVGSDEGPAIDEVEEALSALSIGGWKRANATFARRRAKPDSSPRATQVPVGGADAEAMGGLSASGAAAALPAEPSAPARPIEDGAKAPAGNGHGLVTESRGAKPARRASAARGPAPSRRATRPPSARDPSAPPVARAAAAARPKRSPSASAARRPQREAPSVVPVLEPTVAAVAGMGRPSADDRRRRRRGLLALLLLVVAMAIAAIVVALTGSSSGPEPAPRSPIPASTPGSAAQPAPPAPVPPPSGTPGPGAAAPAAPVARSAVALEPVLPSQHGHGSARLVGRGAGSRIRLSVSGLPRPAGRYAVWLFNTVADAVRIGTFDRGRAELTLKAGQRLSHFRLLDVSLQPPGSTSHSGESVLRARLSKLTSAP